MTSSTSIREPRATDVNVTEDSLFVELIDGRTVSVPLVWYPRLLHGTAEERSRWEFIGDGEGIHWPALDEDVSIQGLLDGRPSGESPKSLRKWLDSRKTN